MSDVGFSQQLQDDGVVLIRSYFGNKPYGVVEEYDEVTGREWDSFAPKTEPLVVFWKHVPGEQKRTTVLSSLPALSAFVFKSVPRLLRAFFPDRCKKLQLLETIIFDKPPGTGTVLNWHQDVAYFPLKPNNQIAVWIPFEEVTKESGAMVYALGSHKDGIRRSDNLHTRAPFDNDDRPPIPERPEDFWDTRCFEMGPTDMLVHDGFTLHTSGPNTTGMPRRGLSVRFITTTAVFDPRPGQGAAFTKQISVAPGEIVQGPAFPDL